MNNILPKGHPSQSVHVKPGSRKPPPSSDSNDKIKDKNNGETNNDNTVPQNYTYDPGKLKTCDLYDDEWSSYHIHLTYSKDCLPIPK